RRQSSPKVSVTWLHCPCCKRVVLTDWDYRGATDVVTHLTLDIEELVRNTDKKPHFLVLAAPGQVALFAGAACICQLH
ncbi:unnamed protein product, partial [Effrenium voratum]